MSEVAALINSDIAEILYAPFMEQEEQIPQLAWLKETLQYAMNHKSRVMKTIRSCSKNKMMLSSHDVDDIYAELIEYLHKSEDYSIQKAMEASSSNTVPTLENYVNTCTKNCVKRFLSKKGRIEKFTVKSITIDEDGKERDLIDTVPDQASSEQYEIACTNIGDILKSLEHKRYFYGADMFQLIYVRLLTMGAEDYKYREILDVLGVSKKDLMELDRKMSKDVDVLDLMKAIVKCGEQSAVPFIEKMVYNSAGLKNTIFTILDSEELYSAAANK